MPTSSGRGSICLYISAIEAAFAGADGLPVPGDQITFSRIRIRADFDVTVPTPGVYRITHPFGVKEFSVAAPGRRVINDTVDIGIGALGDFTGALGGQVGPFLVAAAAAGGAALPFIEAVNPETGQTEQFIGDPNVTQFVTGGARSAPTSCRSSVSPTWAAIPRETSTSRPTSSWCQDGSSTT